MDSNIPIYTCTVTTICIVQHGMPTARDVPEQRMDLGVLPVWGKNITGRGVVVTILDDGRYTPHENLDSANPKRPEVGC